MPISKIQNKKPDKKEQKKEKKELIDFLEQTFYKRINPTKEAELVLKDDTFIQLLRVEGTGASSLSYEEQRIILSYFYTFLSKNNEHMTFETTDLPVSTQQQVNHFRRKLQRLSQIHVKNERHQLQLEIKKQTLLKKIQREKELEETLSNIEYILFLYGDSQKELQQVVHQISDLARGYRMNIQPLTRKEKEMILFQLNNPNTKL